MNSGVGVRELPAQFRQVRLVNNGHVVFLFLCAAATKYQSRRFKGLQPQLQKVRMIRNAEYFYTKHFTSSPSSQETTAAGSYRPTL